MVDKITDLHDTYIKNIYDSILNKHTTLMLESDKYKLYYNKLIDFIGKVRKTINETSKWAVFILLILASYISFKISFCNT